MPVDTAKMAALADRQGILTERKGRLEEVSCVFRNVNFVGRITASRKTLSIKEV